MGFRFWTFFRSVFRILHRKTSVFGFGVCYGLRCLLFLEFGFRVSAKIQADLVSDVVHFGFSPLVLVSFRTTPVAITPVAMTVIYKASRMS